MSDLHVGARDDPVVEHGLVSLVGRVAPDLIVASGDLTHRGRRAQHEQAATLLRSLGPPVLAVPGNHDIPYAFPARITAPWQEFERQWQTTEPVHEAEGALVVGLNSVRPWHQQSGGVTTEQLEHVEERLRTATPGSLRMVALHHQLVGPPWRSHKRVLARRDTVLARLTAAGAELIVGGQLGAIDRKSGVEGEGVGEGVDVGGGRISTDSGKLAERSPIASTRRLSPLTRTSGWQTTGSSRPRGLSRVRTRRASVTPSPGRTPPSERPR